MKTFMNRMVAMSAALVLLCVSLVAQNEQSTRNLPNDSFGVIVSQDYVLLRPGEIANVLVTVEAGYKDPFLIYESTPLQVNEIVEGDSFYAEITSISSSFCSVKITAKQVTEIDSDVLYARAVMINDDLNSTSNMMRLLGQVIVVTVDPYLPKDK